MIVVTSSRRHPSCNQSIVRPCRWPVSVRVSVRLTADCFFVEVLSLAGQQTVNTNLVRTTNDATTTFSLFSAAKCSRKVHNSTRGHALTFRRSLVYCTSIFWLVMTPSGHHGGTVHRKPYEVRKLNTVCVNCRI